MSDPKVLFVTQHFWPELIGSGPYCSDIATWLNGQGCPVAVFTCRPHYPEGTVAPAYQYGQRDRERFSGVQLERAAIWLPRHRGAVGRLLSELTFLLRGLMALATGRIARSDHVISLCPSIFSVLLGAIARRPGGRHIAIVHDIQSGLAAGLNMLHAGFMVGAIRKLERFILNRVDIVMVLSEDMRRHLRDLGVTSAIGILPLWVDLDAIAPLAQSHRKNVVALYSGNFGRKQALDQILDTAEALQQRNANIAFQLRGSGSELKRLIEAATTRGLDNVKFSSLLPPQNLAAGLAEGDIHLVTQNANVADFAVPSKIYTIMAAGRPFVAAAPPGSLLWTFMEETQAFLCVPTGDVDAFARAIERLAADPQLREELGRNGRRYVSRHHDKNAILDRLKTILFQDKRRQADYGRRAVAPLDL